MTEMMRFVGAILVAGCGLWIGLQKTVWYTHRIEALQAFTGAFSVMEWELKNRHTPVPELLERLAQGAKEPVKSFFSGCCALMSHLGDETLEEIWTRAAEQAKLPVTGEELSMIQSLGQVVGRYDEESQRLAIGVTIGQLSDCLTEARAERSKIGRVSGVVGGAAGLLAVILLI